MTTPNAELAYAVLDQIDAHPEQWFQGLWIGRDECGTSGCFAGWTCLLSGDVPAFEHGDEEDTEYVAIDGTLRYIPLRAAELLGIEYRVGYIYDTLFDPSNKRDDLGRLVSEIFGPRPGGEPR